VKRLLHAAADHPVVVTGLLLAVTILLALQLPRLEIDTSAEGLIVEKDPARQYYEGVKQKFGSDSVTVILVAGDDVFTPRVLDVVRRLSDALERTPGVTRVESLTTVRNIRGEGDAIDTEPLVGPGTPDAAALQRIRADALSNRVFVGNIVSADGRATAVVAYTDGGKRFNAGFSDGVERLVAEVSTPGLTIFQIGEPLIKTAYGRAIERDQITVMPLSIGTLFIVLLLAFRTIQGVVIPLVTGILSIVWAMGLMALCGLPLNAITVAVPSLLIAIGFTEDVHMIAEYHRQIEHGRGKLDAIRAMLDDIAAPLLVTSGTTVVGFFSQVFTDITALVQFGWAASIGLTANVFVTLLALPPLLRWLPVPRRFRPSAFTGASPEGSRWMAWHADVILRYRFIVWGVAALVVAGSLVGWFRLRTDTDFMNYFPENAPVRQRADALHRALAGGVVFYLVVETHADDGVKDPRVLRAMADLQAFLARTGRVDKTVSLADYVGKMHREMNGGNPAFERMPDTREEIAQYLLLLEGKELAKYVDFNASTANILVRHNISSSRELAVLRREIAAKAAELTPPGVTIRATGETILINDAADYMAVNELTSLAVTLGIIGLIHAVLFMSVRAGLLSLVPNIVPVLCTFGLMGVLGIPLNIGTAIVATLAIGIAVDDTVHYMVTYNRELNRHHDQKIAMVNTLTTQGRPIIYISLALAAGFFVLLTSSTVPLTHMGLLAGIVMLLAMVAELVLTPLLMSLTRLITLWDIVQLKMDATLLQASPLLRGLSRFEVRKVILLGNLRSRRRGEFVFQKGDAGDELFMIVSGQVRIFDDDDTGGQLTIRVIGPGIVFGEMAQLGGGNVRSATAVAETDVEVLGLDAAALERVRRRFPFTAAKLYRNLAFILTQRLREATDAMLVHAERDATPGAMEGRI
jgi:predicted RND superfamily exporter protein